MNDSTEVRLENLERELAETKVELCRARRRNLWILGGGVLMAGLLALVWPSIESVRPVQAQGYAKVSQEIKAKKFTLVDEQGMDRATLSIEKDGSGPDLVLIDKNYHIRAILGVGKLILHDEKGFSRAYLSVGKGGPSLGLLDEKGKGKIIGQFDLPY
jgi:hypothetical protein